MYIGDEHLSDSHYSKFEGLPAIILLHLLAIVILGIIQYTKPRHSIEKFDRLRDLVRGTILVKADNLFDAYEHFKKIPGVQVLTMRQKIHAL